MIGSYVGIAFALAYSGRFDSKGEPEPERPQPIQVQPSATMRGWWAGRKQSNVPSGHQSVPSAR